MQVILNLPLQFARIFLLAGENHIAARDEGGDIGEFHLLEARAQVVHLDPAVAEIYPAKKGDVVGHATTGVQTGNWSRVNSAGAGCGSI